jgi:4-amino-4-deoxy-L-arabinose transferase-like glycosyltransferase
MIMNQKNILLLFAFITAVYFCAVGVDVMDADASQYAAMSREMKESGSYLQVYEQGKDYLDKPPFLFWINSLSMHIFGDNNFAYKFPSILFALIGVFATYRLSKLFYNETIAFLSALVLTTCQAMFLITNDVRTDTILMGWVALALWQIAEWSKSNKLLHLLLGCAAIGGGVATKGPIALFVPVFAFGSHFILQRKWVYLYKPVYLIGVLVIAIVLVPMSIGLYQQFDLHPEKTVNGLKNVSGLQFFYWTQSFGRITGENVWNNGAGFGFLFENLLWGLLPWTLFFIAGLVNEMIQIIKKKFFVQPNEEFVTIGGFVLTYCSLAISKYQLPHYIYVVLPLIAIITAKMLYAVLWEGDFAKLKRIIFPVQWLVIAVLLIFPVLILLFSFPSSAIWPWFIAAATTLGCVELLIHKKVKQKIIWLSTVAVIGLNFFLSLWFYPNVLQYQAGSVAGRYISKHKITANNFFLYQFTGSTTCVHFYSKRIVTSLQSLEKAPKETYVLTGDEGLQTLKTTGRGFEVVTNGRDFHVTALNGKFLNYKTRNDATKAWYLIKLL